MSKEVEIASFDNLAWYLGCGLFNNDGWVVIARDEDFSTVELTYIQNFFDKRNYEYQLDKKQIKIKNGESN